MCQLSSAQIAHRRGFAGFRACSRSASGHHGISPAPCWRWSSRPVSSLKYLAMSRASAWRKQSAQCFRRQREAVGESTAPDKVAEPPAPASCGFSIPLVLLDSGRALILLIMHGGGGIHPVSMMDNFTSGNCFRGRLAVERAGGRTGRRKKMGGRMAEIPKRDGPAASRDLAEYEELGGQMIRLQHSPPGRFAKIVLTLWTDNDRAWRGGGIEAFLQ